MKKILHTLICIMSINMAHAQNVNIPDAVFKAKLVNNPAINTNGDGEIQVTEAAVYNGVINVSTSGITQPKIYDLTGIQAFTAITNLNCCWNLLTSLDVSANTALTNLYCYRNQLASLDVSTNTALTDLNCHWNLLSSLDVSANTALTNLNCDLNQLTSLDVSANTALTGLICDQNQLTSLNVENGNNSNFTTFYATYNPNLTCIQVDNVAYSVANWSAGKDATASFSTNCATGINDVSTLHNTISIYPNPTPDNFIIALESNNQKVEVTITDITGKIIYKIIARDTQKIEVNIPNTIGNFAAGVYAVQIKTPDFIGTKKLVIQK